MTGTLYIAEFGQIQAYPTVSDSAQIARTPAIVLQAVAMSSSTVASCAPFNVNTQIVRVSTDTNCWLVFSAIGTSIATANATAMPLWANTTEYFGVDTLRGGGAAATTQIISVLSSA